MDYASGLAITDIARCYGVPVSRIVQHLERYGLLDSTTHSTHDDDPVLQANLLRAMAEGRNPYTGNPLPEELLSQTEILRALSAGAAALMRKEFAARAGKAWKAPEEERLVELRKSGYSEKEIAQELQRTVHAIKEKIEELEQRKRFLPTEAEKKQAMQKIKLRPKRKTSKTAWAQEDLRKLHDMARSGMDVLNIASYFGRTVEETETMTFAEETAETEMTEAETTEAETIEESTNSNADPAEG